MKKTTLSAAFCLAALVTSLAMAEDSTRLLEHRVGELEAELASLRQHLDGNLADSCCDGCCSNCGCCDVGCGCCGGCCDACCGCCGWYAGAEAVWVQPRLRGGSAFQQRVNLPNNVSITNTTTFGYDYEVTPRVWLGYTRCCGLGVRGSWWNYEDDTSETAVAAPGTNVNSQNLFLDANDFLRVMQVLELETAEVEFTDRYDVCCTRVLVAFGARYAFYNRYEREEELSAAGVLQERFRTNSNFEGVGPTAAIEFQHPVTCHLSVYGGLRGSIIFGDSRRTTSFTNFPTSFLRLTDRQAREPMMITDVQVGVQWSNGCWYVRGGWQAQYWDDASETVTGQSSINVSTQAFNLSLGRGF